MSTGRFPRHQPHDLFALVELPSNRKDHPTIHCQQTNPNCNIPFLGNDFAGHEEPEEHSTTVVEGPGILRHSVKFMSHASLLSSPPQGTESNGAAPGVDPINEASEVDDGISNQSSKQKKEGTSSALGSTTSTRSRHGDASLSRERLRGKRSRRTFSDASNPSPGSPEALLHGRTSNDDNTGDEMLDGYGNTGWDEESPLDNSA